MKISSRNLKLIPEIKELEKISQAIAMLDAILSPEWEYRYYSFNGKWGEKERLASMRDGSGDDYFILFNEFGAVIKGFAHESHMTPYKNKLKQIWPGVLSDIPQEFSSILSEPAFSIEDTTFCIWRKYTDLSWQTGNITYPRGKDPDGSEGLLFILDSNPLTYKFWVEDYYEKTIPISSVEHIFAHLPLTDYIVSTLNNDLVLSDLQEDIAEIGFPV
jgi:hypothetical protein